MLRKLFFFLTLSIAAFFSATPVVWSQAGGQDTPVELNPICWPKDECLEMRKRILDATGIQKDEYIEKQAEEGWIINESPCNKKDWGKCLPANLTRTEINFGGKNTFTNVGEFLQTNYNYLLGIASVLAVGMIVIAGFQWVVSAGNSEAISSAKKRITGAIVGMFIAYMSYFILNTINPALVSLRLPQTWLVRPQILAAEMCDSVADGTKLAYAGQGGVLLPIGGIKPEDYKILPKFYRTSDVIGDALEACRKLEYDDSFWQTGGVFKKYECLDGILKKLESTHSPLEKKLIPMCGHQYYLSNNAGKTCNGSECRPIDKYGRKVVMSYGIDVMAMQLNPAGGNKYACYEGSISGKLVDPNNTFGDSPLETMWIMEVCNDGTTNEGWGTKADGKKITEDRENMSYFTYNQGFVTDTGQCNNHDGSAGIYLILNLDDKNDIIGLLDDDYAVGCANNGVNRICETNLAKLLANTFKSDPSYQANLIREGIMGNGDDIINNEEYAVRFYLENWKSAALEIIKPYLLSPDDIYRGIHVEINLLGGFVGD
jgi:hypothetical protein